VNTWAQGYELDVGDLREGNGGWEPAANASKEVVKTWEKSSKYPGFDDVEQDDANTHVAKAKWVGRF